MREEVLRRRLQRTLYMIYSDYLEEKTRGRFDEVKESDPYLNQVIEDVLDYVVNDLPLENLVIEKLRGERHVKY